MALESSPVEEPSIKGQLASIRNLCNLLGKEAEEPATYAEAKAMIAQLSAEYNAAKKRNGSKK